MPVHVDFDGARERDVIRIEYEDENGAAGTRYSLINASLGVTAEANARFNDPGRSRQGRAGSLGRRGDRRRRRDDAGDVARCDVRALDRRAERRRRSASRIWGSSRTRTSAGRSATTRPCRPDDGKLGVNLCEGMSPFETVATLAALRTSGGSPAGRRRGSWKAGAHLHQGRPVFALETDGEVVRARKRGSGSPGGGSVLCLGPGAAAGPRPPIVSAVRGRRGRTGCRA